MGRSPLAAGEVSSSITTTRVARRGHNWVTDPHGTHWKASVLIGRSLDRPLEVRRVAKTKREAIDKARSDAEKKATIIRQQQLADMPTSVRQAVDQWLHSSATSGLSDRTRKAYTAAYEQALKLAPAWFNEPLETALTVSKTTMLLRRQADAHGRSAAVFLRVILRGTLHPYRDIINWNALTDIPIPNQSEKRTKQHLDRDRILTTSEIAALAEHCAKPADTAKEQTARDMIRLNLYLGCRANELTSLTWEQVNLETGEVTAYSHKTKTSYIAKKLPTHLVQLLQRRKQEADGGRVFPISSSAAAAALRKEFDAVGLNWCSMHTVRRTVGSVIFQQHGGRQAAAWLCHSSVKTTLQHYVKLDLTVGSEVLDALAGN